MLGNEMNPDIMGPFPAPVARIKDIFRMNILVKTAELAPVKAALIAMGLTIRTDIIIDVEPISIM